MLGLVASAVADSWQWVDRLGSWAGANCYKGLGTGRAVVITGCVFCWWATVSLWKDCATRSRRTFTFHTTICAPFIFQYWVPTSDVFSSADLIWRVLELPTSSGWRARPEQQLTADSGRWQQNICHGYVVNIRFVTNRISSMIWVLIIRMTVLQFHGALRYRITVLIQFNGALSFRITVLIQFNWALSCRITVLILFNGPSRCRITVLILFNEALRCRITVLILFNWALRCRITVLIQFSWALSYRITVIQFNGGVLVQINGNSFIVSR
jgi:hypothetical protein